MIRSLNLIIVLTGLCSFIPTAYSQLDPVNLIKYSETDGNNINDVISDQFGFIWMATENGLLRFDGFEFTRYHHDPNDSTSISQITTHSILEDSKGRIWIGSLQDINVYHPATASFTSYPFAKLVGLTEQELPVISTITENANGTIYFGVRSIYGSPADQALLYYDEPTSSIRSVSEGLPGNLTGIYSSTSDAFGNSWFTGRGLIVRIYKHGKAENVNPPLLSKENSGRTTAVYSDDDGHIWMSFEPSILQKYDTETGKYKNFQLNNFSGTAHDELYILNIDSDLENRIWLATDKGIFMFDESTSLLTGFSGDSEDHLHNSIISSLDFDKFGNIWIGSIYNGLLKYEEKSYFSSVKSSRDADSKITAGWVYSFYESTNGEVWFSTSGFGNESGLNKLDPQTGNISKYLYSDFENINVINDIDPLSDANLLISTDSGFYILNSESMIVERIKNPVLPDSVFFITEFHIDRIGTEWVATPFGLYSKRKAEIKYKFHDLSIREEGNVLSNEVIQVIESNLNGIWLLTNFGLFSANPETGKIIRHGYDQEAGDVFISQDINSLFDDEMGTVWVGTWQGGLSRYNPGTGEIKNYTRSHGLPSMGIQHILYDPEENDLWLATFEGISRFKISTEEFINFTTEDGIHSQLFSDGSGLKTRDTTFFFGGSGGYTFFEPADIIRNSVPPAVSLTNFSVANKKLEFENGIQNAERIELKYNENTISIGFAAIHYSNPDRNKIKYILKNYDLDWHQSGNQGFAYYSGLPPGTYNFEVIAANSKGIWNNEGANIEIKVHSPWWRTWTAYGFYTLFFISGVFSVDHYQRKRLLEKERRKTREKELKQAKEIEKAYHNLELAHEKLKAAQSQLVQQEKLASLGQLTAGIAHEIKNPLNFVNNFSEVSLELIDEALEEIGQIGNNEHASEVRELLGDIRSNLSKIFQHGTRANTIVSSMLQHSRGGSGKMELNDLNALIKEYVNLAYHGMRAGKEPIDVEISFKLDEKLGNVKLIGEDFSRVIINLAKNAFDAMREKTKTETDYAPVLTIQSKRHGETVEIVLADNGPGIPDEIKDKILDPFFTTKKGTEGTGLGLSITYDIIKAHGGELEIQSIKNNGSVFTIRINSSLTPKKIKKVQVRK